MSVSIAAILLDPFVAERRSCLIGVDLIPGGRHFPKHGNARLRLLNGRSGPVEVHACKVIPHPPVGDGVRTGRAVRDLVGEDEGVLMLGLVSTFIEKACPEAV